MDYEKLAQQDSSSADGSERWNEEGMLYQQLQQIQSSIRGTRRQRLINFAYFAILFVSVFLNGAYIRDWYTHSHSGATSHPVVSTVETPTKDTSKQYERLSFGQTSVPYGGQDISPYTGVPRNQIKPVFEESPYHNPQDWNKSHEMWKNINIDSTMIALDQEYIKEHNLPPSEPFPWDTSKSIYVVHGMHSIHCLKLMYLEFKRYQLGEPVKETWGHISHCFETLRQQLVCDAEDTIRAGVAGSTGSGNGQYRMCRDWNAYDTWLKNHTACYKHSDERPPPGSHDIEEFKFCPPGSGYVVRNDTYNGIDFFPVKTDEEHQKQ